MTSRKNYPNKGIVASGFLLQIVPEGKEITFGAGNSGITALGGK